jgi:hypothetical protein
VARAAEEKAAAGEVPFLEAKVGATAAAAMAAARVAVPVAAATVAAANGKTDRT